MKFSKFSFFYLVFLGLGFAYAGETLCGLLPPEAAVCRRLHPIDDQQFLYQANLTYFGQRPTGSTEGAMMSDVNGRIWYTKKIDEEELWREYVGGAVLDTFADKRLPGNNFAKLKLILDRPMCLASEIVPNFSNAYEFCTNYLRSIGNNSVLDALSISDGAQLTAEAISSIQPIGFEVALAAQLLIGLGDRHYGNVGFVTSRNGYECANVDYSHSFKSLFFNLFLDVFNEDPQAFFDSSEDEENEGDSNELKFLLMALSEFSFIYPIRAIGFDRERFRDGFSMVASVSDEAIKIAVLRAYRDLRLLGIEPSLSEIQLIAVMLVIKKQLAAFIPLLSAPDTSDLKCLLYDYLIGQDGLEEDQLFNIRMYFDDVVCG